MIYEEKIAEREITGGVLAHEAGHTGRPLYAALGVGFLPWLIVVSLTAGALAAFHFIAYALMVLAVGYGILVVALPAATRTQQVVLAPALGVLVVSALSGLCLRLRLPIAWIPVLWLALALVGTLGLWSDRKLWTKQRLAYGWSLALLSTLVCLVYFLPSARNDAVYRSDGSFNWIYVDTQHFYAIAAGIKGGESPPVGPGTATEQLRYHFGPYAPAAVISRLTGLDLGDALARVTRGASLWALLLSCFGVGTLLSLKATGGRFGGIMSVAGLFFYGSFLSLFSNEANSSVGHVTGAILFKIPGIEVLADGGPFSHLILGHSVLHGLGAITAIMGLCLCLREEQRDLTWRVLVLLALPALAIPVNSVAALYSLGVVSILIFWGRLSAVRSWLSIALMICLFVAAWTIMGLWHAPDAAGTGLKSHMAAQWWTLVIWFIVGLGFRILAFRWIAKPLNSPHSVLVLSTFLGLLTFSLVLNLGDGNERYGIYYLQSIFSIFAFCLLSPEAWRGAERTQWMLDWLRLAKRGMLILVVLGLFIGIAAYISHTHTGVASFGLKFGISLLLLSLFAGTSALMTRRSHFATACSAALMCVLLSGFLGWITPWLNYGMGRQKRDITIPAAEVQGLVRLRAIAPRGELFATNKHSLDSLADRSERSYAYSALSERPVLLEGYLDRGVEDLPWFPALLRDNDLMFTTTDPNTLHDIAKAYNVRWLVARPGTDLSLSKPLPSWLIPQQDSGSLKIYQIK